MKDSYRALEKDMSGDDKALRNKVQMQERSLDQIQNMYHSVINERSQMKVDLQVT